MLERTLRHVKELRKRPGTAVARGQEIAATTIRPFFEKLIADYTAWPDVVDHFRGFRLTSPRMPMTSRARPADALSKKERRRSPRTRRRPGAPESGHAV